MTNDIISLESIVNEELRNVSDEKIMIRLFELAEERNLCGETECENAFSITGMNYILTKAPRKSNIQISWVTTAIQNVLYVTGLYIRYGKEVSYKEAIEIILSGKSLSLIMASDKWFVARVRHMQKIIIKCKLSVPRGSIAYKPTRKLISELQEAANKYEAFPCSNELLVDLLVSTMYTGCISSEIRQRSGYFVFERIVYQLYKELRVLSKFQCQDIDNHVANYKRQVRMFFFEGNLFELVINNYLFGTLYGDNPKSLVIDETTAKLIFSEVLRGSVSAEEVISTAITELSLENMKYERECLEEYKPQLQRLLDERKEQQNLGELFIVTIQDPYNEKTNN